MPGGRRAAGAEAAADCGLHARPAAVPRRRRSKRCASAPLWRVRGSRRQSVRRFPERRHRQGYRARRARGLRVDRAPQALHHARHGDRSGQDRRMSTASAILAESPAALSRESAPRRSARPIRRSRSARSPASSRQGFPPGAAARRRTTGPQEQGAVFVEPACGCARSSSRRPARRTGSKRRPRGARGARARRHLRRVDARQDRDAGRRTPATFLDRALRQHLLDAAGRQGALRPDAARGRLRARRRHDGAARPTTLSHDHNDRQCRHA